LDRFMSSHYDTEADDEEEAEAEFGRDEEKP
jgi:hypothetical protein